MAAGLLNDILTEIKDVLRFRSREYLPEDLSDEPIVLKRRLVFKLSVWLVLALVLAVLLPVFLELTSGTFNFENVPLGASIFFIATLFYAIFPRLMNTNTKQLKISKEGIEILDHKRREYLWKDVYSLQYHIDGPTRFITLEGISIVRKSNEEVSIYSLNFFDCPVHIAKMLEKYSKKYDPEPKAFLTPEITERYKKQQENIQNAAIMAFVGAPILFVIVLVLYAFFKH